MRQPANPFHPGEILAEPLDLADALGTTAKLWMNLQATYDLYRAKKRRERVA